MRARRGSGPAIAGLLTALALVAGGCGAGGGDQATEPAKPSASALTVPGGTGEAVAGNPGPTGAAEQSEQSGQSEQSEQGATDPASGTPQRRRTDGIEVPEAGRTSSALLPGVTGRTVRDPAKPLLTQPLPAPETTRGALARGWPTSVPVPAGVTVGTSSLSPSGTRLQVALTGDRARSLPATLQELRIALTGAGWREGVATVTGRDHTVAFTQAGSSVTLALRAGAGRTRLDLYGVLLAATA